MKIHEVVCDQCGTKMPDDAGLFGRCPMLVVNYPADKNSLFIAHGKGGMTREVERRLDHHFCNEACLAAFYSSKKKRK